ncbi:STAS domain-containing protein [Nitrospira defluvii]|nr:STAS domain-containing protein [Nitrospira defluvii]
MFKITCGKEEDGVILLRVDGRIVGPWVEELKEKCKSCLAEKKRLILDLSGVSFIDEHGVKVLNELKKTRVEVRGCSLFLSGLLDG